MFKNKKSWIWLIILFPDPLNFIVTITYKLNMYVENRVCYKHYFNFNFETSGDKNLKHNNCLHGWERWFDIQHGPLCYFYGVFRIMGYQILKF